MNAEYYNSAQYKKYLAEGGTAFPSKVFSHYDTSHIPQGEIGIASPVHLQSAGMSLRDWFAGQALVGICAAPNTVDEARAARVNTPDFVAICSYRIADAMLRQREAKQ